MIKTQSLKPGTKAKVSDSYINLYRSKCTDLPIHQLASDFLSLDSLLLHTALLDVKEILEDGLGLGLPRYAGPPREWQFAPQLLLKVLVVVFKMLNKIGHKPAYRYMFRATLAATRLLKHTLKAVNSSESAAQI